MVGINRFQPRAGVSASLDNCSSGIFPRIVISSGHTRVRLIHGAAPRARMKSRRSKRFSRLRHKISSIAIKPIRRRTRDRYAA